MHDDITALFERWKGLDADGLVQAAHEEFGANLGMTTAFGYSGIALMHRLKNLGLSPEIYFIDTGFHFPETLELKDRIRDEWGLEIHTVAPAESLKEYVAAQHGERLWERNPNLCCHYHKVGPLLRILPEKRAWLSALRRDQSSTRQGIEHLELDGRGTLKIYPLAAWTRDRTWAYLREHDLPYHPLHDRDYPSIGCVPCTRPVSGGGDERDGRWKSSPKLECGLHLHR